MLDVLLYTLVFALVSLVAGNNLSSCTGSLISSRITSSRKGIAIAVLGYILGLLLQGNLIKAGIYRISPIAADFVAIPLFVALVIFVIAHRLRVPQSLSITLAMAMLGIDFAVFKSVDLGYAAFVIGFWMAAAVVSLLLTIALMRLSRKIVYMREIWPTLSMIKIMLVIVSFLTAFTLGANTIGFIFASVSGILSSAYLMFVTIIGIIFGSFFLSKGELNRLGSEILPLRYLNALITQVISVLLVEAATYSSVPLSNAQTYTSSLYGAGLSYRTRLILRKPGMVIAFTWIGSAIVSFGFSLLLAVLIYR